METLLHLVTRSIRYLLFAQSLLRFPCFVMATTKGATRAFECATSSCGSPESVRKASGVQAPVAVQRPAVAGAARENEIGGGGRAGDGKRGCEEA